jgi:ditrans,polycis-polyprenyl diphosphate synthase
VSLWWLIFDRAILNICFPYTSCLEIEAAVAVGIVGIEDGGILPEDIDTEFVGRLMYTQDCSPLDVLVRTSGEIRLSDFMLYQVCSCFSLISARKMIHIFISWIVYGQISLFGT